MTAVTSKMNRMVLLYMLILSMVSLPTSLPKHLLVETADNQGGDDYEEPKPEISPDFMGHFTIDQFDKGSETYNKIKELEKKGEDYRRGHCWGPVALCPPGR